MVFKVVESEEEQIICSDVIFLESDLEMDYNSYDYTPLVRTCHMAHSYWKGGQEMNMLKKREIKWTSVNLEYCLYHGEIELHQITGKTYKHRFSITPCI